MHHRLLPSATRINLRTPMRISLATCSSSTIKTYQNQVHLPSLPVPDLKESCDLYLKTLLPIAKTKEDYESSKQAVNEFLSNEGTTLQERLLKYANAKNTKKQSWLEEWWLDAAYLTFRAPLPTNSNYYIIFDKKQEQFNQTEHATHIIRGALEFKDILDNEKLQPDYLRRTTPQCMDQYKKIFHTTRIAKPEKDVLLEFNGSKHIVVICNGLFYSVQVLDDNGNVYHFEEIKNQLDQIIQDSDGNNKQYPVGVITAINRDKSSELRGLLSKNNESILHEIDTSLFAISLDNDAPESLDQAGEWINGGNKYTATKRWYEKLANFIVFRNGWAGLTGEHSPLDAPIVGVVCNHFIHNWNQGILSKEGPRNMPNYKNLNWNIDSSLGTLLDSALEEAGNVLTNCELNYALYGEYGSDWIKKVAKTSPDAYAQMSIQLAYYYSHKESTATYETGTSRRFYHGRTDTVRTLSSESKQWTESMLDTSKSKSERLSKLRNALDSHSSYMKRAVDGKVIDRHFLGLRLIKEPNEKQSSIFTDKLWRESTRFRLSTSNMSSPYYHAGFGPTEEDGYGICYGTRNDSLWFSITSFRSCSKTSTKLMVKNLYKALDDMRSLFSESAKL